MKRTRKSPPPLHTTFLRVRCPPQLKADLAIAAGFASQERDRPVDPSKLAREILEAGVAVYVAKARKVAELVAS